MAADFIHPTGWAASEFISAARTLRAARDQMNKAFAIASHYNNSGDFTALMTAAGTASTADAQALFDLLNGSLNALNGTAQNANAIALIDRIG